MYVTLVLFLERKLFIINRITSKENYTLKFYTP